MKHNPRKLGAILAVLAWAASLAFAAGGPDRTPERNRAEAGNVASIVAPPLQAAPPGLDGNAVIEQMRLASQLRDALLERYSEVRTYTVTSPAGKVAATETLKMAFQAPNQKTFIAQSERGSWVVRDLVFKRLIQSEVETSTGRAHRDSSVSPSNYDFTLLGEQDLGSYHCFLVQATPKRKDKYLFRGSIWIDTQDFAVVRVAGSPARKPSFWIERADFVREYRQCNGFWLPIKDETLVKVRLYGERILTIDHHAESINGQELPAESASTSAAVPARRGWRPGLSGETPRLSEARRGFQNPGAPTAAGRVSAALDPGARNRSK